MTLIGLNVGQIRVLELVGRGGMGEVYAGWHEVLKRKVALKVMRQDQSQHSESRARFLREARILSQLDHPGICRIYEIVEDRGRDVLILEFIAGQSLRQALGDGLELPYKWFIAEKVAEALAAAHSKGVAHRDLKPDNVMLTEDGLVKVLDFGLAHGVDGKLAEAMTLGGLRGDRSEEPFSERPPEEPPSEGPSAIWDLLPTAAVGRKDLETETMPTARSPLPAPETEWPTRVNRPAGPGLEHEIAEKSDGGLPAPDPDGGPDSQPLFETRDGTVMGTIAYMSPEQARGETVTAAGDMYSLGLILQEMFTGKLAYPEGLAPMALLLKVAEAETLPAESDDADLTALIERLKSPAPEIRPSAVDVLERLWWIKGKKRRLIRRVLAAVVLAALILGGIKYTLDLRRERQAANEARAQAEQVTEFLLGVFALTDPTRAGGRDISALELLSAGSERIRQLGDQPGVQAKMMRIMGQAYRQLGFYDEAQPLLEDALDLRRQVGDDPLERVAYIDQLANLYYDQGQYDAAEPLFDEALRLREEHLGESHPHVATSLNNLAVLHRARGRWESAEPLLLRALQIQTDTLGIDHPNLANSLGNLGDLYREMGEPEHAEPLLLRSLDILERQYGEDSPRLMAVLNNLAAVYHQAENGPRAEAMYRRSLAIAVQTLGEDHPNVAKGRNNLAELFRAHGRYAEAETLYRQALDTQLRHLGDRHPDVAVTLANLADLQAVRGETGEARQLYGRAHELQEQVLGADHPQAAVTQNHLADLLARSVDPADREQAEELYLGALQRQLRAFGESHQSVTVTLCDLADLYLDQGRYEEAKLLYGRASEAIEALTDKRPDSRWLARQAARIDVGLGRWHRAMGEEEPAVGLFMRALTRFSAESSGEVVASATIRLQALHHLGRTEEAAALTEKLESLGFKTEWLPL